MESPTEARGLTLAGLLLAWVAGSVDAVGFLTMYGLFVAHMSGNSAALGVFLGTSDFSHAFMRFFPIPVFLFGIALGAVLSEWLKRRGMARRLACLLGVEVVLVASFAIWGSAVSLDGSVPLVPQWRFYAIAALPLLAMGMQNAGLHRVGSASLHTTFVTGVLMSFMEALVKCGFELVDRRGALSELWTSQPAAHARLFGGLWLCYLCGAALSAWLHRSFAFGALVPALCGLLLAIALDVMRPLNAE